MPTTRLSRKIELLARALMQPTATKYQAESAGQSLLELAKEVKEMEQPAPGEEFVPVPENTEAAMEWLEQRYSEEELKNAFIEEHDHARKWIPVRKNKVV
jgi:hypothetical protein